MMFFSRRLFSLPYMGESFNKTLFYLILSMARVSGGKNCFSGRSCQYQMNIFLCTSRKECFLWRHNGKPFRVDTLVVSAQHAAEIPLTQIRKDIIELVIKPTVPAALMDENTKIYVNPTGRFVIGGPQGDSGLTGRKIVVDSYGGRAPHGGGAFSGKDPTKVDRSAAYAARWVAKNVVAAGLASRCQIQLAYAIGVARPVNIYVNTYGRSHVSLSDGEIAQKIDALFDLRPKAIEDRLKLRNPIYEETAAYGHMGRQPQTVTKEFHSRYMPTKTLEVELFTWEKLDYVAQIKETFGL